MFRIAALVLVSLLMVAGAWFGRPDQQFLARQWAISRAESAIKAIPASAARGGPMPVALVLQPPDEDLRQAVERRVRTPQVTWVEPGTPGAHALRLELTTGPHTATACYALDQADAITRRVGWYSVLPPLLAIVSAIIFRRVLLCLSLGILAGGIVTLWPMDHSCIGGAWYAVDQYLIHHSLLGQFRIEILAFILLISAIVGIAQQAGGIHGAIDIIVRFCRTPRAAQLGTAIGGIVVFFDDYLNCIIVGNAFRPLTDRFRVSREKLSYLVDSTAAPVAGLALVSTWIAFEVSQIGAGLSAAGLSVEPFSVFVSSLPYRFYCIFTIIFVFALIWMQRDYGPMLAAERRARGADPDDADSGELSPFADPPARGRAGSPCTGGQAASGTGCGQAAGGTGCGRANKARYAIVPIGFTILAVFVGLWWTAQPGPGQPPLLGQGANSLARSWDYVQQILARTNSARAFAAAAILGYGLTIVMVLAGRVLSLRDIALSSVRSAGVIAPAIAILFLAWAIGGACRDVGTADYLVALFRKVLSPVGFSIVVFGLACLISFATGSSYSTMAILLPNVVPLALAVGEGSALGGMGLVTISVGAVLEGAIFGDHCSPISDTTILSAIASQCDLMDHVRTQIPYAVTCMLVSAIVGYVPISLGASSAVCLPIGAVIIAILIRLLGKRSTNPAAGPEPVIASEMPVMEAQEVARAVRVP